MGGIDDFFESRYSSLTITGRQKIAAKWRPELVKIGNHMRRGKPGDIRAILENEWLARIDGEDKGKALRFAIESSKINEFLEKQFDNNFALKQIYSTTYGEETTLHSWNVADLLKLKDKSIKISIDKFNIDENIWYKGGFEKKTQKNVAKHNLRLKNANTEFPILLDKNLYNPNNIEIGIIDGAHRIVKAKQEGKNYIEAYLIDPLKAKEAPYQFKDMLYTRTVLDTLKDYQISLAIEQDASSSGAQIIALTTKNKQLAEMSNVVPTFQKQRLKFGLLKSRELLGDPYVKGKSAAKLYPEGFRRFND